MDLWPGGGATFEGCALHYKQVLAHTHTSHISMLTHKVVTEKHNGGKANREHRYCMNINSYTVLILRLSTTVIGTEQRISQRFIGKPFCGMSQLTIVMFLVCAKAYAYMDGLFRISAIGWTGAVIVTVRQY